VRTLKRNRLAQERDGVSALVFVTRKGLPYYREREVHAKVAVDGGSTMKVVGITVDNAISLTFSRMARELELDGVTFYRLRHTLKTIGKRAKDRESLDLMMGHKDPTIGKVYDHEEISWSRIKRVARVVYCRLWPKIKRKEDRRPGAPAMKIAGAVDGNSAVA
jgi:hypothetical protein